MNLLQRPFSQGPVLLDERFHVVDGVAMPYRLQVLLEALAAYGDAVLQHSLGFAHGERVSFDGIGVIGEAHAHVFPYLGDDIRGQRAVGIEARLERIQGGKQFGCVFHGVSPAGAQDNATRERGKGGIFDQTGKNFTQRV